MIPKKCIKEEKEGDSLKSSAFRGLYFGFRGFYLQRGAHSNDLISFHSINLHDNGVRVTGSISDVVQAAAWLGHRNAEGLFISLKF